MQSTAQGWLVLELTNSPLLLGVVTAAASLPTFLFTLYAGAVADRMDKRRIILRAHVPRPDRAAVALGVLTQTAHHLSHGCWRSSSSWAPPTPSRSPPARVLRGAGGQGRPAQRHRPQLVAVQRHAHRGPGVRGVDDRRGRVAACFYANGVSYVFVIASLLGMRLPPFRAPPARGSTLENIREGLAYIRSVRAGAHAGVADRRHVGARLPLRDAAARVRARRAARGREGAGRMLRPRAWARWVGAWRWRRRAGASGAGG
jgi:hypothetical protein